MPPKQPTAVGNPTYVEFSKFKFMTEVNEHPSNSNLRKLLQQTALERRSGRPGPAQTRTHLADDEVDGIRGAQPEAPASTRAALPPIGGSLDSLSSSSYELGAGGAAGRRPTIQPAVPPASSSSALVPAHSSDHHHTPADRSVVLRVPPRRFGPPSDTAELLKHITMTHAVSEHLSHAGGALAAPLLKPLWTRGRSSALERMDDVADEQSRSVSPGANAALSTAALAHGSTSVMNVSQPMPSFNAQAGGSTGVSFEVDEGVSAGASLAPPEADVSFTSAEILARAKFANMAARDAPRDDSSSSPHNHGSFVAEIEAELASKPASAQTPNTQSARDPSLPTPQAKDVDTKGEAVAAQAKRGFFGCRSMMVAPRLHGVSAVPGNPDVGLFATAAGGALKARYQAGGQRRKQQQQQEQEKKKSREAQLKDEADDFRRETRAKLNTVVVRSLHSLAMVEEAKVFQEPDNSLPSRCTYPHMHSLAAVRDVPTDAEEAAAVVRQLGEAEKVDDHAPRWLRWGRALDKPLPPVDAVDLAGTRGGLLPKANPVFAALPRRRSRRRSSVTGAAAAGVGLPGVRRKSEGGTVLSPQLGSEATAPLVPSFIADIGMPAVEEDPSQSPPTAAIRRGSCTFEKSPSAFGNSTMSPEVLAMSVPELTTTGGMDTSAPHALSRKSSRRASFFGQSAVRSARNPAPPTSDRPLIPVGRRVSVDIVETGLVAPSAIAEAQQAVENDGATRFRRGAATRDAATDASLSVAQRKIALIRRQAAVENASRAETEANERLRERGGALFRDDELELAVIEQLQVEADRYITTYQSKTAQSQIATQRAVLHDSHTQRFEKGLAARRLMRNRKQVDQEDREELDWGQWRRAATKALTIGLNEVTTQAVASRMQVQWITTRSQLAQQARQGGGRSPTGFGVKPPEDDAAGDRDDRDDDGEEFVGAASTAAANDAHSIPCFSARTLLAQPGVAVAEETTPAKTARPAPVRREL